MLMITQEATTKELYLQRMIQWRTEGQTLQMIADKCDCTREYVRQLLKSFGVKTELLTETKGSSYLGIDI